MTASIRLTLRPGDKGTRALTRKYGRRLVAVRYRYDPDARCRLKTVELIEDKIPWVPPPRGGRSAVRVCFHETELRARIKDAGGTWLPKKKLWLIDHALVSALGLTGRVVEAEHIDADIHA